MYRLRKEETDVLVGKSESGMGYQIIHAKINDLPPENYIVFNCELVIEFERLKEVPYASAEDLLTKANYVSHFELKNMLYPSDLPPPTGGPHAPPSPLAPTPRLIRNTFAYALCATMSETLPPQ